MQTIKTLDGTELQISTKLINPHLAQELLRSCKKNRASSKARVARYAQGMALGEWVVGQPILLDKEGNLLDGEHRMRAVINSKQPVEFLVVEGFDRETTFAKLDDVGKRSLKDWLHIRGVENPRVVAGVVTMAARDEQGLIPSGSGGNFYFTPIEGLDFLDEHPSILESVRGPGTVNPYVTRAMSCFCHWKFRQKDQALADTFFIDLCLGEKEGEGDPIYLLRERMKSDKRAKAKLGLIEKLALVYKAWNAVRAGKQLHNLRWRSTGPGAEVFPEVE